MPVETPPPPPPVETVPAEPSIEASGAEQTVARRRSLVRRKGFWWSTAAVVVVAGDAVLVSLTSGWRAEAADLQTRGHDLGERISIANGLTEGQQNQIDILTSQTDQGGTTLAGLTTSADTEEASAHDYRDVALQYQSCYDARGEAIASAWAGASAANALATANASCAAADAASASLAAGN